MANHCSRVVALACLLLLPVVTLTQTAQKSIQANTSEKEKSLASESDPLKAQRRIFAVSLVTSLADEARTFRDQVLRPRVLARSADALWSADSETARTLFRRAWEAAETADSEVPTSKSKDDPPPMVTALRRIGGFDLRSEVLGLAARRDRALGEEFLNKLQADTKREADNSRNDSSLENASDGWSASEAESKRLQLARKLLDDGQIDQAVELAAPVLNKVTANSIGFLSTLRQKRPEAADRSFAFLLARAEFDPLSDANTVSGLSSYAFTPGLYVTFSADGGVRWSSDTPAAPPNLPAALRNSFFQAAASILLRPLPQPDQDFTSSGRNGKFMVVKRLLPLFERYAPDSAAALRAQQTILAGDQLKTVIRDDHTLLTQGLQPEETAGNAFEKMQDRLDRAKTSRDRDVIYADAAAALANQGDVRAPEVADKIDDSDRRAQVRRYVDLKFVQLAIQKKEASELGRLAKAGELTHTQRAWAYTEAARLLMNSERARSLQFLAEATDEARRIDGDNPDRARSLIGVATQFVIADRVRAWEIMGEAIKSANAAEEFTGENSQFSFLLGTRSGLKTIRFGDEDMGLTSVMRSLSKDDLHRSTELARSFRKEAPRANATLAVVRAVLDN